MVVPVRPERVYRSEVVRPVYDPADDLFVLAAHGPRRVRVLPRLSDLWQVQPQAARVHVLRQGAAWSWLCEEVTQ